ncbi:MAG: putative sulfate exporter family transporter [Roseburia sp.]|nr:putative sulfate exporter family transporter [Roseburia sp.]
MSTTKQYSEKRNKYLYITILSVMTVCTILGYIPGISAVSTWITPPSALFTGLIFALIFGQPFPTFNKKMSKYLLQYSVVGLGFGMNVEKSLASGKEGMMFTIVSVFGTLLIGWIIGRKILKVNRDTSYLISSGTAICGGSAIAAVGPVIKAKGADMSVALGVVFILNAIALFIFPPIGHWLGLDQQQFGTWAAIAIHDTSSVVGAGQAYGEEALEVATTIKLTRALWIVPLALLTSFIFRNSNEDGKRKIQVPMFIVFFILALVFNTYVLNNASILGTEGASAGASVGNIISSISKKCLTITLFFIGASLSLDVLKSVGIKPLIQGVLLWIVISIASLIYILC